MIGVIGVIGVGWEFPIISKILYKLFNCSRILISGQAARAVLYPVAGGYFRQFRFPVFQA